MDNNTDPFESFLEADEDAAGWMVTFADLMTLLLVFFVLLYSISSFNLQKFVIAFKTMQISTESLTDPATGLTLFSDIPGTLDSGLPLEALTGLRKSISTTIKLYEDLNQMIEGSDLEQGIDIEEVDGKIIITIKGSLLFDSGSAELNRGMIPVLEEVADLVSAYPDFLLNIKGHTDNVPISTGKFPSNWELSAIRATAVLKQMITAGLSPERMTATGYGDVMPVVPNSSEKNRSLNRRVEFVLEKKSR